LLRKPLALLLVVGCISLVLLTRSAFARTGPVQAPGYIDIWTNSGGQGLYQYGGSYDLGEKISVYIESRVEGYGVVNLCYQSIGENCHEYDSGYVAARDVVELGPDPVEPPSGKQYFLLHICPSPQIAELQQSNCPYDYTWIEVGGQTTVQTASSTTPSEPTYTTNVIYSSFTSAIYENSQTSPTSEQASNGYQNQAVNGNVSGHFPVQIGLAIGISLAVIAAVVLVLRNRLRKDGETRVY
jgi:hypothetical protein